MKRLFLGLLAMVFANSMAYGSEYICATEMYIKGQYLNMNTKIITGASSLSEAKNYYKETEDTRGRPVTCRRK